MEAMVEFNEESQHFELYVPGEGVVFLSWDEDEVCEWAEWNGYEVEYD